MKFVTEKLNSYYMEYESGNGYELPFGIYIELQDLLRECRHWLQYIAPVSIVIGEEVRTVTAEEYAGRRPGYTKVENVGDDSGGGLQHDIEELRRIIANDHETIKTLTDDISALKGRVETLERPFLERLGLNYGDEGNMGVNAVDMERLLYRLREMNCDG
jgi:hypothetical protein